VHFEQRRRHFVHRRAPPDAGDAGADAVHLHHEDAAEGRSRRQRNVRGRKTELPPEARTTHHAPADGVVPTEQACRALEFAGRQRRAHC
jgi:hypothetical protein